LPNREAWIKTNSTPIAWLTVWMFISVKVFDSIP
jgi:hypothetical protein